MKNIIIKGLIFILIVVSSCSRKQEYDDLVRPDYKLNKALEGYQDLLISSPNGWIGYLYPSGGGGFTFKFKFEKDNIVWMQALLNEGSAKNPQKSSYSLRAPQIPSLYFDTYSYIHELADPAVTQYGGSYSVGAGGDFEFGFVEAKEDTIWLRGNFRKSDLVLIKANAEQGDDFVSKAYDFVTNKLGKIENFEYYYKKIKIKDKEYAITINTDKSTLSLWYDSEDGVGHFMSEYAVSEGGIMLRKEFVDGDIRIMSLSDIDVDFEAGIASLKINNEESAQIIGSENPLIIDPTGPIKLFGNYSKTYTTYGFTFAGERDYIALSSEPSLLGMYLKQRYYYDNYDALYFDYIDSGNTSSRYLAVIRGNINTPKIIKYAFSNYNGPRPNTPLYDKIVDMKNWFSDQSGFYVYETGEGFYDLVSVEDSRKWIRLF